MTFGLFVLQVNKIKHCKDNVCPFVTSFGQHSVCGIPPYCSVLSQSFYSLFYMWHPFVWLYHTLFTPTSVDRHLNSVVINIIIIILPTAYGPFFWTIILLIIYIIKFKIMPKKSLF